MGHNIARPKYSLALAHGSSATTVAQAVALNGMLIQAIVKTPAAVDASATATLNVLDSDGNTVYTKSGVAVNTTSINLLTADTRVPLSGTQTIQIVYSAAQTATDTTSSVTLLIDKG